MNSNNIQVSAYAATLQHYGLSKMAAADSVLRTALRHGGYAAIPGALIGGATGYMRDDDGTDAYGFGARMMHAGSGALLGGALTGLPGAAASGALQHGYLKELAQKQQRSEEILRDHIARYPSHYAQRGTPDEIVKEMQGPLVRAAKENWAKTSSAVAPPASAFSVGMRHGLGASGAGALIGGAAGYLGSGGVDENGQPISTSRRLQAAGRTALMGGAVAGGVAGLTSGLAQNSFVNQVAKHRADPNYVRNQVHQQNPGGVLPGVVGRVQDSMNKPTWTEAMSHAYGL